ncbi:RHS repeat-associated core domain-containing protein [Enterobacter bugandensis]
MRFQGQYFDEDSSLDYNRYRYYEPESGRYISPDPIGLAGGLNNYAYAPNAFSWFDPLVLRKCTGGFSSADNAARAALNKYNPMSIFKNREYGEIIYRAKTALTDIHVSV